MKAEVLTHAIDYFSKTPMDLGRITLDNGCVLLARREHDGPWFWTWWGNHQQAPPHQRVGGELLAALGAAPHTPIADWVAAGPKGDDDAD